MTPLQRVGMGFVIVALDAVSVVDLLPDWAGWALVLWGVASLPLPERTALLTVGGLSTAVAAALWFPQVRDQLGDAELSLRWAASLPDLLFIVLLCRALIAAARREKPPDTKHAGRFAVGQWGAVVVAVLPPIGHAADNPDLLAAADLGFVLLWLWMIWHVFAAHRQPYAGAEPPRDGIRKEP